MIFIWTRPLWCCKLSKEKDKRKIEKESIVHYESPFFIPYIRTISALQYHYMLREKPQIANYISIF